MTARSLAAAAALGVAVVVGGGAVAAGATPGPSPAVVVEDERSAERDAAKAARKAERDAAKAARKAGRDAAKAARRAERPSGPASTSGPGAGPIPSGPAFVCDPALTHGQNVSAYARSLPKGPGRGRLVSAAARSDCGRPGD